MAKSKRARIKEGTPHRAVPRGRTSRGFVKIPANFRFIKHLKADARWWWRVGKKPVRSVYMACRKWASPLFIFIFYFGSEICLVCEARGVIHSGGVQGPPPPPICCGRCRAQNFGAQARIILAASREQHTGQFIFLVISFW